MFKRVLVANRGEIAVRIVRACRDMGIWSIALFDASDQGSLHVRLADECVELKSDLGYLDAEKILEIALECGADAVHPGYGFLSERADFIRLCEDAGITFIGPPSRVVERLRDKTAMLERVRAAGFAIPVHSSMSFDEGDETLAREEADRIGYPVILKSCRGGRGRATRLVRVPGNLEKALHEAQAEAQIVFGNKLLYMERAIAPARFIDVQIIGDHYGNLLHLGERDGSLQRNNQKLVAESPAPGLTPEQRAEIQQAALEIAQLFEYCNVGTVEFLLDDQGDFYFTEIKARIQVEHPVTEAITQVDLVREQFEIAYGKRLLLQQDDVDLQGHAMQCRINAEDPWNNFLPSPGRVRRFRLPGGPGVRVDTYAYSGCDVPVRFDPILAKVIVWGENRDECVRRMRRTLQDFAIGGIPTNLPLHQRILEDPDFVAGRFDTGYLYRNNLLEPADPGDDLRDLAVAAALAYLARHQAFEPVVPDRLVQGWHRANRRLNWD